MFVRFAWSRDVDDALSLRYSRVLAVAMSAVLAGLLSYQGRSGLSVSTNLRNETPL